MTQQTVARPPGRIQIGRVVGVPVYLTPSWFLFAAFIVITSAPPLVDRVGTFSAYIAATSFAVLLLASVLLHEVGHCLVARAFDLPVRSITVTLLAGLTEITEPPQTPAREYAVAISGPLVSLLLAGIGVASVPLFEGLPQLICEGIAITNGIVAAFNLLPGLPLDGGRVLKSIVWQLGGDAERATRASAWAGRVVALVVVPVVLLGILPEFGYGDRGISGVLFSALLGAYIYAAATASLRRSKIIERLPGVTVARLAKPALGVPSSMPLAEAVRQAQAVGARALVVLDSSGQLEAVVSEAYVAAVPVARRPWVTVGDGARRVEPGLLLDASLAGEDLLAAMRRCPAQEYVVPGDPPRVLVSTEVAAAVGG